MSEFIAPIAFFALLGVVGGVLYYWSRKRLASTSAYWRTRPTALEITGMCVLALVVMGLAMNALPQRWPEWLRGSIGLGTFAAISWGGWMIRHFRR
jgi:peptidoglycan biosynthesis protein MviN/MurJ (putative lipid II flippase)